MRRGAAASIAVIAVLAITDASVGAGAVPFPRPAPQARGEPAPTPAAVETRPAPPSTRANDAKAPAPGTTGQAPPRPPLAIGAPPQGSIVRPGGTLALDPKQRALVERVSAYLSGLTTLVGNFVQVGPNGSRTEGQFFLQKPGRLRFEYDPPSPIELIADGQSMVVRDRRLATQDLYPLSQTPLRFLLADRIDLIRDTNLIGVSADDMFVSVTIEERHTLGGTHRLMLMFSAQDLQLKQWTVTDPQGYDTTVAVYNLDSSKKLDPALFKINYERMLQ